MSRTPKKKEAEVFTVDTSDVEKLMTPETNVAVSIIPRIEADGRTKYDIVSVEFSETGVCGKPKVLFTEIKESTAITRLLQAAHEELNVKVLRDKLRVQRSKSGK